MGSVCDGQVPVVAALAVVAVDSGLVIFAGAGVSSPLPTDLPKGDKVAERAFNLLANELNEVPECDSTKLTSLADAMERMDGGIEVLRTAVLRSADYLGAEPNEAHAAMAALFLEGAAKIVTTNWDDCIERAAQPERIQVIVSDEDQLRVSPPAIYKVHGCATQPASLKASTRELEDPNPWARAEVHSMLGGPTIIFVGVGHIAGYVKDRLKEIVEGVGDVSHIRIVSPSIQSDWEKTGWAELVASLALEHRIEMTGEEFTSSVVDAYCGLALDAVETLTDGDNSKFDIVRSELCSFDGVHLIGWLRDRGYGLKPGQPLLHSDNGKKALLALAFLPGEGTLQVNGQGVALGDAQYELLIAPAVRPARDFRREAQRRSVSLKSRGAPLPDAFVCSGTIGPLSSSLGGDVISHPELNDVLDGPTAVDVALIDAEDLVKGGLGE